MLIVHHLGISQSERILWLCEELHIDYKIVKHERAPLASPESLKSVPGNASGKAPFIEDTGAGVTLSESGAICEYIITKYGNGRLAISPDHQSYADYLHWFHWTNATLQATMVCAMFINAADIAQTDPTKQFSDARLRAAYELADDRLKNNKWLAGDDFTAADIMCVYPMTTQRYFGPLINLAPYPNILRYLKDCGERPAYQRAMEKGDPEMKRLLGPNPPETGMIAAGGVKSQHWKI